MDADPFNFENLPIQDTFCVKRTPLRSSSILNENVINLGTSFTLDDCLSSIDHTKNIQLTSCRTAQENRPCPIQASVTKLSKKKEESLAKKAEKKQARLEKQKLKQEEKEKRRLQKQLEKSCKLIAKKSRGLCQYANSARYNRNNLLNPYYQNNDPSGLQFTQPVFDYSAQVRTHPCLQYNVNFDNSRIDDSLDLSELLKTTDLTLIVPTEDFNEQKKESSASIDGYLESVDLIDRRFIDDFLF